MNWKKVTGFSAKHTEFSKLLFASDVTGMLCFHATLLIRQNGNPAYRLLVGFSAAFTFEDESAKEIVVTIITVPGDATGHTLSHESFTLLFVCYVIPSCSISIIERILMLPGSFLFSDSCVEQKARDKLNH